MKMANAIFKAIFKYEESFYSIADTSFGSILKRIQELRIFLQNITDEIESIEIKQRVWEPTIKGKAAFVV